MHLQIVMEPPAKRIRLSPASRDPDSDLARLEPGNEELEEARAQNDQRLKSLFEGIFEKYGRDFSDIGDEVDLRTGEIVVNKGHLIGMRQEDDIGIDVRGLLGSDEGESEELEEQGVRERSVSSSQDGGDSDWMGDNNTTETSQLFGKLVAQGIVYDSSEGIESFEDGTEKVAVGIEDDTDTAEHPLGTDISVATDRHEYTNKLRAVADIGPQSLSSPRQELEPIEKNKVQNGSIEPMWQLPEIDAKFSTPVPKRQIPQSSQSPWSRPRSASPPDAGSLWALPSLGRRPKTDLPKEKKPARPKAKRGGKKSIARDWSFAQLGDGSESDDPLQEDVLTSSIAKSGFGSKERSSVTPTPTVEDKIDSKDWKYADTRGQSRSPIIILDDESTEDQNVSALIPHQPSEEIQKSIGVSYPIDKRQLETHIISPSIKNANRQKTSPKRDNVPSTPKTSKACLLLTPLQSQHLLVDNFDDDNDNDDDSRSGISSIHIEATPASKHKHHARDRHSRVGGGTSDRY
jgi:hypothetical protein